MTHPIDALVFPELLQVPEHVSRTSLTLLPVEKHPVRKPWEILLSVGFFEPIFTPEGLIQESEGEDEDDVPFIYGKSFVVAWMDAPERPLFDLETERVALGKVFPRWYDNAIRRLELFLTGQLLHTTWALACLETTVPATLGGIMVNVPAQYDMVGYGYRLGQVVQGRFSPGNIMI